MKNQKRQSLLRRRLTQKKSEFNSGGAATGLTTAIRKEQPMSLKEEIVGLLPDYVTSVKVERTDADLHGLGTTKVTTYFRKDNKPMFVMLNFANKNKMDAPHMAAVIKSYLRTAGMPV